MTELKNLRFSFLVIAFLVCNLIVLPFDFFIQLKIEIPFWVFYLLEVALVFLMIFFALSRSAIYSILKVCVAFLIFISVCFLAQGFLPFAPEHKIMSFNFGQTLFSTKIVINIVGLLVLNLVSCFLFISELLRAEEGASATESQEHPSATGSTLQYQKNRRDRQYKHFFERRWFVNEIEFWI